MLLQTYLFVPATEEELIKKALRSAADVVIVDLEDAVAVKEKGRARQLLRQASQWSQEWDKQMMVRINGVDTDEWKKDLEAVVKYEVRRVMLPKTESAEDVEKVAAFLEMGNSADFHLVPLVESAKGVLNAYDIVMSHPSVERLAFGSVDYTLDIRAESTKGEQELLFARSQLINVSAAAHIAGPIDCPFTDFKDESGFMESVKRAKKLGMQAKLLIHPRQIEWFERVYKPSAQELEEAAEIIKRFEEALANGIAAISYKGGMIDYPIYKKAKSLQNKFSVSSE